jgi:3-deoxy-D-manno-octulosonic acid kinase
MVRKVKSSKCYILQPQASAWEFEDEHFAASYWQQQPGYQPVSGGRGGSCRIEVGGRSAILRHYYRGGLVAKLLTVQYLWFGKTLTRPWREWNILLRARKAGLPVPEPIAACACRSGLWYRAAIITAYLEGTEILAQRLAREVLKQKSWYRLGLLIKHMHSEGIRHADLNASNILIDARDQFYLIDFDKARVMNQIDDWQWRPLYRLQGSLNKFSRKQNLNFSADNWQALMDGYQS